MKSFLKQVLAGFFGSCFSIGILFVVASVASVVLIVGITANIIESVQKSTESAVPAMPGRAILVIDLSRGFSDAPTLSPANRKQLFSSEKGAYGLLDTAAAIEAAAQDDAVCGVLLYGGNGGGSDYAATAELLGPLGFFRQNGKPIFAYLPSPSLGDYFLATAGDEIWIHPFSELPLQGLASSGLYFKTALENLGIGVQITRVGTHKSAVEPLISEKMSPEDREQRERLLVELSNVIYYNIAGNRTRDREKDDEKPRMDFLLKFYEAQNEQGLVPAAVAAEKGFVDAALYEDEMIERLKKIAGTDDATYSFSQVSLDDYMKIRGIAEEPPLAGVENFLAAPEPCCESQPSVAIVYAEGEIVDGFGTAEEVGGQTYSRILRDLRNDDSVKAVVLRINSPGGSVFASEQIRREAELLAAQKPLVVSMGGVAASGGYWISTPAKKVFAMPTTVTGSIGVFGVLFNFENLGKKIGVTTDAVAVAPLAELETVRRPKTPEELAIFQQSVDRIYAEFLRIVANARKMTTEQVDALAQGQVWTGASAKQKNLVDELGSLEAAIAFARTEAGLDENAPIISVPGNVNRFQELFDMLNDSSEPVASAGTALFLRENPQLRSVVEKLNALSARLRAFNDPNGIYARLPFDVPAEAK